MLKQLYNTVSQRAVEKVRSVRDSAHRFRNDVAGVASIEMAFIFPVMLILYFGLVDVTNLLSANRRVTMTSSTIADLVTQAAGTVDKAELDGYFKSASHIMDPFDDTYLGKELFSFRMNSGTAELMWERREGKSCGTAPTATTEMITLMNAGTGLVVSRVCYDWTPIVGKVIGSGVMTVEDQMILRPRQSETISCSDCA